MADLTINSRFGLLSVLVGPEKDKLEKLILQKRDVDVTIKASIVDTWSDDDGIDQEFQMDVHEVIVEGIRE